MAVFRIEKNSDFTIMPNYPFRDMRLSFKGRGLLGTMLTLRDDWDYTLAGLTAISPHGKSYVTQANEGDGLLFYGNVIVPFVDRFPKDTEMYRMMTTKPNEMQGGKAA